MFRVTVTIEEVTDYAGAPIKGVFSRTCNVPSGNPLFVSNDVEDAVVEAWGLLHPALVATYGQPPEQREPKIAGR